MCFFPIFPNVVFSKYLAFRHRRVNTFAGSSSLFNHVTFDFLTAKMASRKFDLNVVCNAFGQCRVEIENEVTLDEYIKGYGELCR